MPVKSEGDDDKGSRSKNDLVRSCDRKLLSSRGTAKPPARDPGTFSREGSERTQEVRESPLCRSLPFFSYSPPKKVLALKHACY